VKKLAASLAMVLVLALLLANEEIQIEGSAGWAANLPTWRIEGGWLLELFWGGRAMTGYHVFIFSFVALFFHFPFALFWRWSWRDEARAVACLALFWVAEDFLWFLLNPAYRWAKFTPPFIPLAPSLAVRRAHGLLAGVDGLRGVWRARRSGSSAECGSLRAGRAQGWVQFRLLSAQAARSEPRHFT
jgi:hypothetical protein